MALGKPKEPKAPKEKKPKKEKPPKEKKPKKPKKGQAPEGQEGEAPQENGKGKKRRLNPVFLIVSAAVIVAAAVIVVLFVLPRLRGGGDGPDAEATVEPQPPVLPTELPVGDEIVPGMTLEADESEAKAVLAKTITYTYIDLVDAGKVAETYVGQLRSADPSFSVVDEEFVRILEVPDYTTAEGMVLMARNLPVPEPEAPAESEAPKESEPAESDEPAGSGQPEASPAPAAEEPVRMVLTVRITWSEGQCVVTADEAEGTVTSPPRTQQTPASSSVTIRGAQARLEGMTPAELGLSGETMENYTVFPMDGVEMVNGVACITLYVYSDKNSQNGNEFMGSYLMSIDGLHLYRVNPITGEIEVLE